MAATSQLREGRRARAEPIRVDMVNRRSDRLKGPRLGNLRGELRHGGIFLFESPVSH